MRVDGWHRLSIRRRKSEPQSLRNSLISTGMQRHLAASPLKGHVSVRPSQLDHLQDDFIGIATGASDVLLSAGSERSQPSDLKALRSLIDQRLIRCGPPPTLRDDIQRQRAVHLVLCG